MERRLNIENDKESLNVWVKKSINLFNNSDYLDKILEVYPFQISAPERLEDNIRKKIISAYQRKKTDELIEILKKLPKFPYDEPIWFLLKNIGNCIENNPRQVNRIIESLYSMSAEEIIVRLEAAPKLNTQMGPMFNGWLRRRFDLMGLEEFEKSERGICILDSSEEVGKSFINNSLHQNLPKRPDLIAKVNGQIIIGEAKWIGQSGGNQEKQVTEVVNFCKEQRGNIIRIGIIDGYPWAIYKNHDRLINDKVVVNVQESEYDIITTLLLEEYFHQFI